MQGIDTPHISLQNPHNSCIELRLCRWVIMAEFKKAPELEPYRTGEKKALDLTSDAPKDVAERKAFQGLCQAARAKAIEVSGFHVDDTPALLIDGEFGPRDQQCIDQFLLATGGQLDIIPGQTIGRGTIPAALIRKMECVLNEGDLDRCFPKDPVDIQGIVDVVEPESQPTRARGKRGPGNG